MMDAVLLTGITGFVGGAVARELQRRNIPVVAAIRGSRALPVECARVHHFAQLDAVADWSGAFDGVKVVVHAAARVHVMNDTEIDPLLAFRKVNVEGTLNLARQAAAAGVKRFIFLSSIKVNGESTDDRGPFSSQERATPKDPYGVSKLEAEEGLRRLAGETGLEVVIVRPVLVYGPGVKANFHSMMSWLRKGVPLPFGAIHNKRSLVALGNLVDLLVVCLDHPKAANQTFLVSDGDDLSTTQLLTRLGRQLGRPARLLPVPAGLLKTGAAILGKRDLSQRLCGSLQVDIGHTRELLGWTPPLSVDDGLKATAVHFLNEKNR